MSDNQQKDENRETIADVLADFQQYVSNTKIPPEVAETIVCYLDRIKAVAKREQAKVEADALSVGGIVEAARQKPVGNAAATREALEAMNRIDTRGLKRLLCELVEADIFDGGQINKTISAVEKARRALSAPPRNCDVGTAKEQTARYKKFCSAHKYLGSDFSYMCKGFGKGRCPLFNSHTKSQCEFAWAQMPYEAQEGGAK